MTDIKVVIYTAAGSGGSPGRLSRCRVDAWMRSITG